MAKDTKTIINTESDLSERAMEKVLRAEEQANQAIRQCEQDSVQLIQDAKNRAQKISKHADKRISHIHLRFKQCIARQVKDLQREYAAQHQHIHAEHYDTSELGDIVDRVADMLTGSGKPGQG